MSLLRLLFSEYPSVFYYFYSRLFHSGVKVTYNFYHFFFFVLLTIRACIKSQFCKPVYLFIIRDHKLFGYKTELIYRKIPKMFWGWYFSKAFFEALIFGGAYMQRKFAFKNRLGWYWEGNVRLKIDWDSL